MLQWWARQIICIDWTVESMIKLSLRPTLIDIDPHLQIRYIHMAECYTAICQLDSELGDDMLLVSCESTSMHVQFALHSIKCVAHTCTHTDSSLHNMSSEWSILVSQHSTTTHHCSGQISPSRTHGQLYLEITRSTITSTATASCG